MVMALHFITISRGAALTALAALAGLAASGCLGMMMPAYTYDPAAAQANQEAAMAQAHDAVDANMVKAVADAREASKAAPGSSQEARRWAGALEAAYETKTVERGKIDGAAETAAVCEALDAAAKAHADDRADLLAAKGRVLLLAGKKDEGVSALQGSMKARPNTTALVPLIEALAADGKVSEVAPLCKKTRANVKEDDERFLLLDKCLKASGQPSVEAGLLWATKADVAFYKDEQAKAEARAEERARERQARADQMMAESRARDEEDRRRRASMGMGDGMTGGSAGESSGGSGGGFVPTTIEIRSECSRTVPVFYGEKPKFGSGTRSSVSSNSISSAGRKPDGSMTMWIIDESENGLANAHATASTKRIIVDRSCSSLRTE